MYYLFPGQKVPLVITVILFIETIIGKPFCLKILLIGKKRQPLHDDRICTAIPLHGKDIITKSNLVSIPSTPTYHKNYSNWLNMQKIIAM